MILTSMVSNPANFLAKSDRSRRHSSGVVVPHVFRMNRRWETNIELSLNT
jgi:hypothetical protein